MKIRKMFCSIDHTWNMRRTDSKAKILCDRIELIKFICLLTMIKYVRGIQCFIMFS